MSEVLSGLLICFFCTSAVRAQRLSEDRIAYLRANNIELIDTVSFQKVLHHTDQPTAVIIFTNHCVGTPFVFLNQPVYDSALGTPLRYVLVSSAPADELKDLVAVLKKYAYTQTVYLIDPGQIKDDRKEDRQKGISFRDAICKECSTDDFGLPYYIFYDKEKLLFARGFASKVNFLKILGERHL